MNTSLQFVDLGLISGVLWADRNIGANTPEKMGNYYRFGETIPCTQNSGKYQIRNFNECICATEFDVSYIQSNKQYRMPTREDVVELIGFCKIKPRYGFYDYKEKRYKYVKGYDVYGPNNNSIFLPQISNIDETTVMEKINTDIRPNIYWTGTTHPNHLSAFALHLSVNQNLYVAELMSVAACVRPVTHKYDKAEGRFLK